MRIQTFNVIQREAVWKKWQTASEERKCKQIYKPSNLLCHFTSAS